MILVLGRNQWFYYDEWSFLVPNDVRELLAPHVGHLSAAPTLLTWGLRALVEWCEEGPEAVGTQYLLNSPVLSGDRGYQAGVFVGRRHVAVGLTPEVVG